MNPTMNNRTAENIVRSEILDLDEYTLKVFPATIKLNQNENPYELPGEVKREILDKLASLRWSRYPPFVPNDQLELLASFAGWKREGTLLGNGSNDILQLLFTSVLEKGRSVVISQPTFTLYKLLARGLGADVVEVLMRPPFRFDVEGIIAAAQRSRASMVVVCSPNNPTGTLLAKEEVVRLIEGTDALVVLDEAYVQFAPRSLEDLLAGHDRLVILRTFSKAMGAAGLRLGYGLMSPVLAKNLDKVKLPYSVNVFTLLAAEVLVQRWETFKGWIDAIAAERERVFRELCDIPGIRAYPSAANFLLFESGTRLPREIFASLLQEGILIRDVSSYPLLGRCLRVSIGTPEENSAFLSSLRGAV